MGGRGYVKRVHGPQLSARAQNFSHLLLKV